MSEANIDPDALVEGTVDGVNPHLVTVGRHCVVGERAALLTHCPIRGALPVTLDDYVWIGYGALVLPGVHVGECSVIGAGAVVTRNVPPGAIVAGNPARILRLLTESEKTRLCYRLRKRIAMGRDSQNGANE